MNFKMADDLYGGAICTNYVLWKKCDRMAMSLLICRKGVTRFVNGPPIKRLVTSLRRFSDIIFLDEFKTLENNDRFRRTFH